MFEGFYSYLEAIQMHILNIALFHKIEKTSLNYPIRILTWHCDLTLSDSNYLCLEQISMVPKDLLKFKTTGSIFRDRIINSVHLYLLLQCYCRNCGTQ